MRRPSDTLNGTRKLAGGVHRWLSLPALAAAVCGLLLSSLACFGLDSGPRSGAQCSDCELATGCCLSATGGGLQPMPQAARSQPPCTSSCSHADASTSPVVLSEVSQPAMPCVQADASAAPRPSALPAAPAAWPVRPALASPLYRLHEQLLI